MPPPHSETPTLLWVCLDFDTLNGSHKPGDSHEGEWNLVQITFYHATTSYWLHRSTNRYRNTLDVPLITYKGQQQQKDI